MDNQTFRSKPLSWSPIPELERSDGDITLVFLSGNGVLFSQEMNDDWYRATQPGPEYYTLGKSGVRTGYYPDTAASPMGCLEQWQWCNPAYPKEVGCGPLASYLDSVYGAAPLFNLTSEELDESKRLTSSASGSRFLWQVLITNEYPSRIADTLGFLGLRALASQSRFFDGIQYELPSNQWQLDVLNWWHIVLANLQASWSVNLLLSLETLACPSFT